MDKRLIEKDLEGRGHSIVDVLFGKLHGRTEEYQEGTSVRIASALAAGCGYVGSIGNFIFESAQSIMAEGYCRLPCDAVYSGRYLWTFRKYDLPRFAKYKNLKSSVFLNITTL
jgi:hypothetical protein